MLKITRLVCIKNIFSNRVIMRHYIIQPEHRKSFHYQILNYFKNIDDARTALERYEVSSRVKKTAVKNDSSQEKFQSICKMINNLSDRKISRVFLYTLDSECLKIINSLTHSQILGLLNTVMKIFPFNELIKTQFYKTSMEILFQALECELLNQQQIIQLLFIISLRKEEAKSYINYLKNFLPNMKDVDLIDKCIIAEAFYKSSLKLTESQCRALEELLHEKSEELIYNTHLLVPLCKAIRLSKPTSQLNVNNLNKAILSTEEPLNFTAVVHILSLYAEALLHEPDTVAHLIKDSIQTIVQHGLDLRLKDIDRFMWSVSRLGFSLKQDEKLLFMEIIEKRLPELKKKENLGLLVNILLNLHLLDCWSPKVIKNCFEEKVFEPVYYEKFHWKIRSRLNLLLNLINIELNLDIPKTLKKEIKIAYTVPEDIDVIAKMLSSLTEKKIVQGIKVDCPIKGLQIPGISLITETRVYHIDLLYNFTCLRNTYIPHGLMQLKVRLLAHLKFHHILIEGNLITKTPDKILSRVKEEICKNICKTSSNKF